MPVKSIVANVCHPVLHPLNLDGPVLDIEVVAEEVLFGRLLLPVKLVGDTWVTFEIGDVVATTDSRDTGGFKLQKFSQCGWNTYND